MTSRRTGQRERETRRDDHQRRRACSPLIIFRNQLDPDTFYYRRSWRLEKCIHLAGKGVAGGAKAGQGCTGCCPRCDTHRHGRGRCGCSRCVRILCPLAEWPFSRQWPLEHLGRGEPFARPGELLPAIGWPRRRREPGAAFVVAGIAIRRRRRRAREKAD